MYEKVIKRMFDIVLSTMCLLLFSWLLLLIALAVRLDDGAGSPVIFTQTRVGAHGTRFTLHKFRTMKPTAPHDCPTHLLEHPEDCITRVGGFLRRTSLDELPQLWDILRGKMSVIGPRPALWNQDDLLAEREKYGANDVRPGLTGWAQINGRDEIGISRKAELDGEYTRNLRAGGWRAFAFDCRCFFGAIFPVLRCEGVAEGGKTEREK